jgi:hypothetical protein
MMKLCPFKSYLKIVKPLVTEIFKITPDQNRSFKTPMRYFMKSGTHVHTPLIIMMTFDTHHVRLYIIVLCFM